MENPLSYAYTQLGVHMIEIRCVREETCIVANQQHSVNPQYTFNSFFAAMSSGSQSIFEESQSRDSRNSLKQE